MARTLRQCLFFALVTLAIYSVVFTLLCIIPFRGHPLIMRTADHYTFKGGVSYASFHGFDPEDRYDAIVIGSSHAYHGYDPRIFDQHGIRMYNLGSSAQTPMNSYYVLRNMINADNTGLVIFDLYENTFEQDGLESTSDLTRNIPSTRAALQMAAATRDLRTINMLALRFATVNVTPLPPDSTYRGSGFSEHTDSLHATVEYVQGRPLQLNAMQLDHFQACLRYCKEAGIPLVLVSHYYPKASDCARHQQFRDEVMQLIAGTDVHYIDLAYAHSASDTDHFYDHNHLNAAGVALFNAQLLDSLGTLGILHPH